ncbi:MAG: pyrrolysine--tRNA(Pyl) ligase large subunit [Deltaproteobacteria bacterium]|jgi:phenylalanyl-tRNA synthetase alpha chain|nr:pyrrolysine--tRNA(Pyl) ligase large subunit [Deltaproteobacteria bacterium]
MDSERSASLKFTPEQLSRLRDLGAETDILGLSFASQEERRKVFQDQERLLAGKARGEVRRMLSEGHRPLARILEERLSKALSENGFAEVMTPIAMSRSRLEKMGLKGDPLLAAQVFWLDEKSCLRPMLAPHLYEYMLDLARISSGPFRIFEIGPCFRKESKGARHGGEFTMLNLVEVGTKEESRLDRLKELASLLMGAAGLEEYRFDQADSSVYGQTVDVVSKDGLELASCSMGPHPLDEAWGFDGSWVGLGLGIERLAMALSGLDRLSPVGRGFGRLGGLALRL